MRFFRLDCPHCGATLTVEDGIESFYCEHCGGKVILEGQDKNIIDAKVKLKEFEHKERLKDKEYEYEKYKLDRKAKINKDKGKAEKIVLYGCIFMFASFFGIMGFMAFRYHKEREDANAHLLKIEEKVEMALENNDLEMALFYVNQLHYNGDNSRDIEVWDEKRESYLAIVYEQQKVQRLNDSDNRFVPASSDDFIGKEYTTVIEQLTVAGFTNITSQKAAAKASWLHPKNTVEHIIIGGQSSFTNEDCFNKDIPIIIYYYSK